MSQGIDQSIDQNEPPVMRRMLGRRADQQARADAEAQRIRQKNDQLTQQAADRDVGVRTGLLPTNTPAGASPDILKMAMEHRSRQLGALQQFQYNYGLQAQTEQGQFNRQLAGNEHEDELFERHEAGRIAEMHLEHLQQQDQFKAQQAALADRDQAIQTFDLQKLGQEQGFKADQDMFQAGVQELRDARLHDFDVDTQGRQQDFQVGQANQKMQMDMVSQLSDQMHRTVLQKMALDGQQAREKLLHRMRYGEGTDSEISTDYHYKMQVIQQEEQAKQDQFLNQGLESGSLILDPAAIPLIGKARQALASIWSSNSLTPEEKKQAMAKAEDDIKGLTRQFARPQSAAERSQAYLAQFRQMGLDPSDSSLYSPDPKTGRPMPNRAAMGHKDAVDKMALTAQIEHNKLQQQARLASDKGEAADLKGMGFQDERKQKWEMHDLDRELRVRADQDKMRGRLEKEQNPDLTPKYSEDEIERRVQKAYPLPQRSGQEQPAKQITPEAQQEIDTGKQKMADMLPGHLTLDQLPPAAQTEYTTIKKRVDQLEGNASPDEEKSAGQQRQQQIAPDEFAKQWATLQPGEKLVGPDGQTYVKKGRRHAVGTP